MEDYCCGRQILNPDFRQELSQKVRLAKPKLYKQALSLSWECMKKYTGLQFLYIVFHGSQAYKYFRCEEIVSAKNWFKKIMEDDKELKLF